MVHRKVKRDIVRDGKWTGRDSAPEYYGKTLDSEGRAGDTLPRRGLDPNGEGYSGADSLDWTPPAIRRNPEQFPMESWTPCDMCKGIDSMCLAVVLIMVPENIGADIFRARVCLACVAKIGALITGGINETE